MVKTFYSDDSSRDLFATRPISSANTIQKYIRMYTQNFEGHANTSQNSGKRVGV